MTLTRRTLNTLLAGVPLAAALPAAWAQSRRDSVVLGMVLEPAGPGPDHRAGGGDRRDRALQHLRRPDQDRRWTAP